LNSKIICHLDDIPEGSAARFIVAGHNLIVIQREGRLYAYSNECPHMNMPLTYRQNCTMDKEQKHLVCAQHAAEFTIENGLCDKGPCIGMKLEPVSIELIDDNILLKE
jgi:nitrite reductase/ring-hydroxylating ferredoxin subunit